MITLYTTRGPEGTLSLSPFCAKLDVWLQLAGLPFERRTANPREAPRGKIPYVDIDGERMGDSQLIIERLTAAHGVDLDGWLTARERAVGHLMRRTLEEATYFVLVHTRWCTEHGFAFVRGFLLDKVIPAPIRPIALPLIKRQVRRQSEAQGTGRHTLDDIHRMGIADIEAIAELIGDNPYALGDRVSSVDATAYGFLSMILHNPYDDPIISRARQLEPITGYCQRFAKLLAEKAEPARSEADTRSS